MGSCYIPIYELFPNVIFEFGKYSDEAEELFKMGEALFDDVLLKEEFNEYHPRVVGKEGLLYALDSYEKCAIENIKNAFEYQQDLKDMDKKETNEEHLRRLFKEKLNWVSGQFVSGMVDRNEKNKYKLNSTWLIEYDVFELAHILKTYDWVNKSIIHFGW
jgi:hypothetical protein